MIALYAKIGQQQIALEQLNAAYDQVLILLAQVVSGEVSRDRVMVNLTERSWVKSEPGARPTTPATINGLPQCVIAPESPAEMSLDPKLTADCVNRLSN